MNPHEMHETYTIDLTQLIADEDYQPREETRESHVRLLMASDPDTWPPLLVSPNGDGRFCVIDGFHRLEAALRLGIPALPCIIDASAGYAEGFAANLHHGLVLTLADRKAFACWLHEEEPALSYRELGRRSGLHHETVKRALEEDGEPAAVRHQSPPDPIRQLVRQVDRTYRAGHGRTRLGFGSDGNPKPFRREIEAFDDEDQPKVARALLAFGHACVEAAQPYLDGES